MRKELYATPENIREKGLQWTSALDPKHGWKGPPSNPALLILDMQRFFLDKGSHAFIPTAPSIVEVIRDMASGFKGPVIATRHVRDEDHKNLMNLWWRDSVAGDDAAIIEELADVPDLLVDKKHYSAFCGTGLGEMLVKKGADSVIITGVHTDLCCETTARDAFMRGLKVYFIADATATATEERHEAALRIISIGFGEVLTSEESMSLL
jgi:isochorismate hydrolase